jgi:hypothetical protein
MAPMLNSYQIDSAILSSHPFFSCKKKYIIPLAVLLAQEAAPDQNNPQEHYRLLPEDEQAINAIKNSDILCFAADDMLRASRVQGKKLDALVGIAAATGEALLAVECKLKMNGGRKIGQLSSLCDEVLQKYKDTQAIITDVPTPFSKDCILLFASGSINQILNTFTRIRLQFNGKFKHLRVMDLPEFDTALLR